MKIIKLHSSLGTDVYVNIERINLFYQGVNHTILFTGGSDESMLISETPEEIIELMRRVNKK